MSDLILKQEEVNGKLQVFASVEGAATKLYDVTSSTVDSISLTDTPKITERKDYHIPSNSAFYYPYNMESDSLW